MPRLTGVLRRVPPIMYGAYFLAAMSLAWSAYAITDVMHSGPFGLSVAVAGDIGWITIMWAEQKSRGGRAVIAAGWVIASGVAGLLVVHGIDERSVAQSIAGPFVVLVGKTVGTVAIAVTRDPAALRPEHETEINDVIREGERTARLNEAQRRNEQLAADAFIARIEQQARITAARDEADFRITLSRLDKHAEIERKTPLTLSQMRPQALPAHPPETPLSSPVQDPEPTPLSPAEPPASAQLTPPEPLAPTTPTFGFQARVTAQSAERAKAVQKVAQLLAQDPGLTAAQVEERLSVSPATAKRYLREARQGSGR